MACYKPRDFWRTPSRKGGVRSSVVYPGADHKVNYDVHKPGKHNCGYCIGCRLEYSRQWACRLVAEAQCHQKTSFLTLTYKEMPAKSSLNNDDFTLFMKRLRRHFEPNRLRYYQCGEYGEKTSRPHHHCILFGEDFSGDRHVIDCSQSGLPQYGSSLLERLWSHGKCTIGDVTFESAAYVSRYTLKKFYGKGAKDHYGERKPEYATMSRNPGIGAFYFEKYVNDMYPGDFFVPGPDRPAAIPPKYFDALLEKSDPELFERVKRRRKEGEIISRKSAGIDDLRCPSPPKEDESSGRLLVREELKNRTIDFFLKRGVE